MPRPELYPVKKVIGFDREMLEAVEKWRAKQKPIPTVSDAIRRLVGTAIAASRPAKPRSEKATARARDMAAHAIDQMSDRTAPAEDRDARKKRLLKGPREFRDIRVDLPKPKRSP
jgi:hypothetical protein